MRFGVALPTSVEGMANPIRFADHNGILRLAIDAEKFGYDSVLVNDHLSTMPYVREKYADPPRFYEPLITLTHVASHTTTLRLMTGVIVIPMREPVLLAKQVATLDQISNGRVTLGVGVGAYRAEFEAVYPARSAAPRGELVAEGIQSLKTLFDDRRSTFHGKHFSFDDVEMFPKPVQDPFPILSCGNAEGTIKRAGEWCAGWMPAGMPADRIAAGVEKLHAYAADAGRDGSTLEVAPQLVLCLGRDTDAAMEKFIASQTYEHLVSLRNSTLKGVELESFRSQNLIGSPEQIIAGIERLRDAGATQLAGMIVVADTEADMSEQMEIFGAEVMPSFTGAAA
jgi:probable F420-dependent oxidoreductase